MDILTQTILEEKFSKILDIDPEGQIFWDSLQTLEVMVLLTDNYGLTPNPARLVVAETVTDLATYAMQLANGGPRL